MSMGIGAEMWRVSTHSPVHYASVTRPSMVRFLLIHPTPYCINTPICHVFLSSKRNKQKNRSIAIGLLMSHRGWPCWAIEEWLSFGVDEGNEKSPLKYKSSLLRIGLVAYNLQPSPPYPPGYPPPRGACCRLQPC